MRTFSKIALVPVFGAALFHASAAQADLTPDCNDDPLLAFTTECGTNSDATGIGGTAIGQNSSASIRATAVGYLAAAPGAQSIAIGSLNAFNSKITTANGASSLAIGPGAQTSATATAAVALGASSVASAADATAIGPVAQATASAATAVGRLAIASGVGSIAIGNTANASADGSIALGHGSVAAQVNTVSVGASGSERRIVNVAAGIAATDAANVGQLNSMNAALGGSIASLQANNTLLFDLADRNRRDIRDANDGVAMALALDTPNIPAGAHVAVSGGVGYFKNRLALASAISVAVGEMSSVSAGLGYGFDSKEVGARGGFQIAW